MPLLDRSPRLFRGARRTLAAALAVAAVAGCGGSDDPADVAVAGTYQLVAFNGAALPYTDTQGTTRSEIQGGELDLRADRTFDVSLDGQETDVTTGTTEVFTEAVSGSYTQRGNVLTFGNSTGGVLDGARATVEGTTVTLGLLTFRR